VVARLKVGIADQPVGQVAGQSADQPASQPARRKQSLRAHRNVHIVVHTGLIMTRRGDRFGTIKVEGNLRVFLRWFEES